MLINKYFHSFKIYFPKILILLNIKILNKLYGEKFSFFLKEGNKSLIATMFLTKKTNAKKTWLSLYDRS